MVRLQRITGWVQLIFIFVSPWSRSAVWPASSFSCLGSPLVLPDFLLAVNDFHSGRRGWRSRAYNVERTQAPGAEREARQVSPF